MARNASQKKEGMFSRMISVVGGGGDETDEREHGESPEGESATTMLKAQHEEVRKLFKEFDEASENARSSRKRIADDVSQKLDVHAQIEERIFYPACRSLEDEDARKMVGESLEEHLIVKRLIAELAPLDGSDETFESKFTVLKENVEHHADEEEKDLFPAAEKELGDERLEKLGAQMAEMMRRLQSEEPGRQARRAARRGPSPSGASKSSSGPPSGARGKQAGPRATARRRSAGSKEKRSRSRSSGGSSRTRSSSSGRKGGRSKRK